MVDFLGKSSQSELTLKYQLVTLVKKLNRDFVCLTYIVVL